MHSSKVNYYLSKKVIWRTGSISIRNLMQLRVGDCDCDADAKPSSFTDNGANADLLLRRAAVSYLKLNGWWNRIKNAPVNSTFDNLASWRLIFVPKQIQFLLCCINIDYVLKIGSSCLVRAQASYKTMRWIKSVEWKLLGVHSDSHNNQSIKGTEDVCMNENQDMDHLGCVSFTRSTYRVEFGIMNRGDFET